MLNDPYHRRNHVNAWLLRNCAIHLGQRAYLSYVLQCFTIILQCSATKRIVLQCEALWHYLQSLGIRSSYLPP